MSTSEYTPETENEPNSNRLFENTVEPNRSSKTDLEPNRTNISWTVIYILKDMLTMIKRRLTDYFIQLI